MGGVVFTFLTSGYVTPTSFVATFGTGTPQGEQLCLGNVNASLLPPSKYSTFRPDLRQPGSACAGPLDSLTTPNPAATALAFSVQ
jgi:hypothetical protein